MDLVTALAIVISIMGGGATWAAVTLGSPFVLIWAIFIAWASFFAAGGTPESLTKSIAGNIWGIVCATVALIVAQMLGVTAITAAIVVLVSVFVLIMGAKVPLLDAIPTGVFGYASTAAIVLMGGSLGADSGSVAMAAAGIATSMVIGNILGFISGKLGGSLVKS